MARREGPGRLHSIDLLPAEADAEIHWANGELAARRRTQADILFELNDRLAVVGCGPISASAFNRYAIAKASATRAMAELTAIGGAVAEVLGTDSADKITLLISQMIRVAAYRHLSKGDASPRELLDLSRALNSVIAASSKSAELVAAMREATRGKIDQATEAAADGLVAGRPELDRADVLKRIRQEIYQIYDDEAAR